MLKNFIIDENHVFKNRDYFILWFGQLISTIGTSFYRLSYMWWIALKTDSAMVVSKVVLLSMLPGVFLGVIAGKLVDKWNKKYIIVLADVIQGIVIFTIFYLSYFNLLKIYHFYLSAFISSLMMTFFRPAVSTSVPLILKKEKFVQANSLLSLNSSLANILAPLLSGVVIAEKGIEFAFLIAAVAFILSAISEMFLCIENINVNKNNKGQSFFQDLKHSIFEVSKMKIVIDVIIVFSIINFALTALNHLPILIKQIGFDSKAYGYLRSAEGIGMLIMSLSLGTLLKSQLKDSNYAKLLTRAFIILPISMSFLAVSKTVYISIISQLLIGSTVTLGAILLNSIFQMNIPQDKMGICFGLRSTILDVIMPLGLIVSGFLGDLIGIKLTICLYSGIVLLSLIPLYRLNRSLNEEIK